MSAITDDGQFMWRLGLPLPEGAVFIHAELGEEAEIVSVDE